MKNLFDISPYTDIDNIEKKSGQVLRGFFFGRSLMGLFLIQRARLGSLFQNIKFLQVILIENV